MSTDFVAYIDESGDEGFGKLRDPNCAGQSRWLGLGAAIVSADNDRRLPAWRDDIMTLFRRKRNRDLHFKNLNHSQKVAACMALSNKQVGVSVVASNKVTLLNAKNISVFKRRYHLYNYLVRFLLERVTASCKGAARLRGSREARLRAVFSRRSGTDYQTMREYLEFMRNGRERFQPVRSIDWTVLDPSNVSVENHSKRAGLQIADVLTSATCAALEPDEYGNVESRYALILRDRYISIRRRVQNAGITIIPSLEKPTDGRATAVFAAD